MTSRNKWWVTNFCADEDDYADKVYLAEQMGFSAWVGDPVKKMDNDQLKPDMFGFYVISEGKNSLVEFWDKASELQ